MATVLYESYYGCLPLDTNVIEHHGIHGQKWGHRRWQNEDGSLTPEGYIHYGVGHGRNKARTDKDSHHGSHADSTGVSEARANRISSGRTKAEQDRIDAEKAEKQRRKELDRLLDDYVDASDYALNGKVAESHFTDRAKKLGYNSMDDAIDDAVRMNRADKAAKQAAKEAKKEAKAEAKKERLLEKGSTKLLQKNLDNLSLAELRQVQRQAEENRKKEQTLSDILKERRAKKEAERDLKRQQKEAKQEAAKVAAIKSGDPTKIEKYAKTMTTEELQTAIDRVNKVNTMSKLALERQAENRIKAEARRASFEEKMGILKAAATYIKGQKDSNEHVTPIGLYEAVKNRKVKEVELTGSAKEAYESGIKDAANKAADKARSDTMKYTGNVKAAENAAKSIYQKMLKDITTKSKDEKNAEKVVKDIKNEKIKNAASKAYDDTFKSTNSVEAAEKAAKEKITELSGSSSKEEKAAEKQEKKNSSITDRMTKLLDTQKLKSENEKINSSASSEEDDKKKIRVRTRR